MMITTVVVPLDGSEKAERALSPAREIAEHLGGSVLLFRAVGDDEEEVRTYLERIRVRFEDLPVRTLAHRGFASYGLAEEVRAIPGAAVCMVPDLAAPSGSELGPSAEDAIDTGHAPVLLVGPAHAGTPIFDGRRGLVLCADGSAGASCIESLVAEWAAALHLEVHLVTVLERGRAQLAGIPVERVLREVSHLGFRLERRGLRVHLEVIEHSLDPAFAITRYAATHPIAMIATSARGHRHDLVAVVGSTVLRTVHLAPVPVLVAQPQPVAVDAGEHHHHHLMTD